MCGLIGYYSKYNKIHNETLMKALSSIKHRGPDESHTWINSKELIGLAHNRLSIVGIEDGSQPISNKEHSIFSVVNGEFYDYKEIRKSLEEKGYSFSTNTDSELIIPLYQEYGTQCLNYLNGEFAFILYDKNRELFFCARDRFGTKPLFFSLYNNAIYIASEIKAILSMNVPAIWNDEAFIDFSHGIPNQKSTLFKNIHQLNPGNFLLFNGEDIKEEPYWRFTPKKKSCITYNDAIDQFKTLLDKATKRRLIADVEIGCYLSGGLDSSSILYLASQYNPNIHAFTISFDDPSYDELHYAESLSGFLGVKLSSIKINDSDLANNYRDAIYHRESLIYQTSGIAKFLLSGHVQRHGIKSVITGEGADEILLGYPSFKEDYLLNCLPHNLRGPLLSKLVNENSNVSQAYVSGKNYPELLDLRNKLGYTPSFLKLSCEISQITRSILDSNYMNISNPFNRFLNKFDNKTLESLGVVEKSQYLWSKTFFPELILSFLGDRMEMAHSIEGRLPFLDTELVSFVNSLPIEYKINKNLTDKLILRDAMKGSIPEEIRLREKNIFSAPPATNNFQKNKIFQLMHQVFTDPSFKEIGIYDQERTSRLLNELPNMSNRMKMISEFSLHVALSTYFLKNCYRL